LCLCTDPVIKIAIEPKSKGDLEKMSNGLIKLAQEDPSFHFTRDEETNQTVIEGMGELHLDIIVDRLRREFKAGALPSTTECSKSVANIPKPEATCPPPLPRIMQRASRVCTHAPHEQPQQFDDRP